MRTREPLIDWLIECATASSKGVVSTLHQCTTTASQLLERRRNCIYRERESHQFSSDIRPPCLLVFSLMVVLVYLFPPRWGAFCVRKKKGSRVCVWALRWVKGKWRHFHNDSHLLAFYYPSFSSQGSFLHKNENSTQVSLFSLTLKCEGKLKVYIGLTSFSFWRSNSNIFYFFKGKKKNFKANDDLATGIILLK